MSSDLDQLRVERDAANEAADQASRANNADAVAAAEATRQRLETPLGQAEYAADRWMTAVDAIIRDLWGPFAWVRYTGMGKVYALNTAERSCRVVLESDIGAPPPERRVLYGRHQPRKGKTYPVYQPYQLPPEGVSLLEGPVPAGDAWLHAASDKWLYYATDITTDPNDGNGYAYGISRLPWPPVAGAEQAVEHLCVLQGPREGYELREFIGVDGFGNIWFQMSQPLGIFGVCFFSPSRLDIPSSVVSTSPVRYLAVDATPGQCHLAGYVEEIVSEITTTVHTPLIAVFLSVWLHLQSDGGTTFAAGDPPVYTPVGTVLRQADGDYDPSRIGAHGHYVPPNDGTSVAPHYHWFRSEAPSAEPPHTDTGADFYPAFGDVYLGQVAFGGATTATVANQRQARPPLQGASQYGTWGTRPFSGAYLPAYLASVEDAIGAVLAFGSMAKAWGNTRILPSEIVSGPMGRPVYGGLLNLRGHVWTRQEGEGNPGAVEVAIGFAQSANPTSGIARFGVPNLPPAVRPADALLVPGIGLGAQPAPYAVNLWSLGPAADGRYHGVATWAATESARGSALAVDWYCRPNGGGWTAIGQHFRTMFADGRDARDLMVQAPGGYQYSEDGGTTWQPVPITLPFYPLPGGQFPRLRNGFIVEA